MWEVGYPITYSRRYAIEYFRPAFSRCQRASFREIVVVSLIEDRGKDLTDAVWEKALAPRCTVDGSCEKWFGKWSDAQRCETTQPRRRVNPRPNEVRFWMRCWDWMPIDV